MAAGFVEAVSKSVCMKAAIGKPVFASCALIHSAIFQMASSNTWQVRTFIVHSQALHLLKARSIGLKSGKHKGSSCKKADLQAKQLFELDRMM